MRMRGRNREMREGDIFTIPLYLPSYQAWRHLDELIDYRGYRFRGEDPYAFGRLIERVPGNMNLVEVFAWAGRIPETPEVVVRSGRLFAPVMMGGAFSRGRWRFLWEDPGYDKWRDSDYGNIRFLMSVGLHLWQGGQQTNLSWQQDRELRQAGVRDMEVYGSVGLEVKIRALLAARGVELQYEQTVEARRNEYPQPRDPDRKLKETIAPFRWSAGRGAYALYLDAGRLNSAGFEKVHRAGNGYDWEKAARTFVARQMPECGDKLIFDCEADTFSVRARVKKPLRAFALAFHACAMDAAAFEELLRRMENGGEDAPAAKGGEG